MADESTGDEEGDADINGGGGSSSNNETEQNAAVIEYELHRSHHKVLVRQLPSRGLSFQVWPAASALCWVLDEIFWYHQGIVTAQKCVPNCTKQYLANGPELSAEVGYILDKLVQNRGDRPSLRIIELGAGTGMVGIAAALLGAQVTITDLPHVLPNLEYNASANEETVRATALGGSVRVKALRWGEGDDALKLGRNFDLVLASDVVYHEHLFDPLLVTLKWLLLGKDNEVGNPIVLMAHLRRWKKDAHFFKKAKKLFEVRIVHKHPPPRGSRLGVVVYCFTNKEMNKALV
eukprot:Gb_18768 [translate_table: standard]